MGLCSSSYHGQSRQIGQGAAQAAEGYQGFHARVGQSLAAYERAEGDKARPIAFLIDELQQKEVLKGHSFTSHGPQSCRPAQRSYERAIALDDPKQYDEQHLAFIDRCKGCLAQHL